MWVSWLECSAGPLFGPFGDNRRAVVVGALNANKQNVVDGAHSSHITHSIYD